jgi:hypothetical protein
VALGYTVGVFNAVLDVVIIVLPIPRLLKLEVSIRQKLGYVICCDENGFSD